MDIGLLGGGEEEPAPTSIERMQTNARVLTGQIQPNYYFPLGSYLLLDEQASHHTDGTLDPKMPNWKPVSMRWPYMILLIVLSLALAAIQETLCQISLRRRKEEEEQGLLRFTRPKELSMLQFFSWKYLPTMIAVTFGILWQIVDYEVKRLEPYYQLSQPEGALAIESLTRDYLTGWAILAPFKAVKYRQWAVFYSSVIYLLAGPVIPVLQATTLIVTPSQEARKAQEPKFVHVHPIWSRLLTGSFIIVAIFGCLLMYQLRRRSGLLSDPNGIAGVAAMANKSHILMDFKDLDTATEAAIHHRLKRRRYNLHKSTLWQGEFIKVDEEESETQKGQDPHPPMLRLTAGVPIIVFMLLYMGFIPLLMFVPKANVVAQKLPWLLIALASIIKILWGMLDSDVRAMEPFYILSRRHAPSSTLTLDYTGTIPGWLPIKALLARHYLVALVGLGAVMSEVLTVCVSSLGVRADIFFPNKGPVKVEQEDRSNSEETFKSVWVSFALVMGILTWLILSAALVYHRRRHPFLPREPGTIASVLAFIHQSKMLWDFVDTEKMNSRAMTVHLRRKAKTYGFGWFKGRDGHDHCGIDEEPLTTKYKHGVRFADAVKPWSNTWDRY